MNCKKSRKALPLFLDGELPGARKAALEQHLGACPDCAAELRQMERALAAMDDLPSPELSDDFDQAFARKLVDAKRDQRLAADRPRKSWFRLPVLAPLGAGVCAAGIAAVLMLGRPPSLEQVDDLELARNLSLLQDYELVQNMDALVDFEVVEALDTLPDQEVAP